MSANAFVPLNLDGKEITCDQGEFHYDEHPVVFLRREITHRPTGKVHQSLAMVHLETSLTIFSFVVKEEEVLILAPQISGGMPLGSKQVGTVTDPAMLAFVRERMAEPEVESARS